MNRDLRSLSRYGFFYTCHKLSYYLTKIRMEISHTVINLWSSSTQIVACFVLGRRDFETAKKYTDKLQKVASGRFQLTTDGLRTYLDAVEQTFGIDIDFAQLVKTYKSDESRKIERRYSPGDFVSAVKVPVMENPVMETVSTSYVERQNLTMRMSMRRLTRLTNGFSKKWENIEKALALHFAYYNFCRVHQSLRVTPGHCQLKAN